MSVHRQSKALSTFLFISSGSQNKMFTLRYCTVWDDKGPTTEHICSLSIDREKARVKAERYANLHGLEFRNHSRGDLDPIVRMSPEEVAQVQTKRQMETEARLKEQEETRELNRMIGNARMEFFFGKHEGKTMDDVFDRDPDYVKWIMGQTYEDPFTIIQFFILKVQKYWAIKLFKSPMKESSHVGSVGDKLEVTVLCTKETSYVSDYGWVNLYICQDSDGNVYKIKYTGSKWSMDQHSRYLISGTVKSHDVYQDVNQTVLTRVKLLENK